MMMQSRERERAASPDPFLARGDVGATVRSPVVGPFMGDLTVALAVINVSPSR